MFASAVIPSVADLVVATVVAAAIWWAAGWALARRLLRGRSWLTVVAVTPAVGIGSTVMWNEVLQLARLEVTTWSLALWIALTAVVGCGLPLARADDRDDRAADRPARWVAPGVAAVVLAAGALWVAALHGDRLAPDQSDNTRHGFFVARILDTGSSRPEQVAVDDVRSGEASAEYYPLTMHATAAVMVTATGLSIPAVLGSLLVASVAMVLVPGLALLSRRLARDDTVAVAAAAIGACLLPFPADLVNWGAQPMLVAMAACPATAVAIVDVVVRRRRRIDVLVPALALTGVFGLHNTQCLVAAILALGLVGRPRPADWRATTARVAWLGAFTAILSGPELWHAARGAAERTNADPFPSTAGALAMLRQMATYGLDRPVGPLTLTALMVVGAVAAWRRGAGTYVAGLVVVLALAALAAQTQHPVVRLVTLPWYGFAFRLMGTAFLIAAPLAGWGAVTVARRTPRPLVVGAVAALAFGPQLTVLWLQDFQGRSSVGSDELEAMDFLATVHRDGMAVLTESRDDGGLWLYALHAVPTTFGFPVEYHSAGPEWSANLSLLELVARPDSDPDAVAATAQGRCVEYVLAAEHPNLHIARKLRRSQLRDAPFVREVFTRPTVSVFRIVGVEPQSCGSGELLTSPSSAATGQD